MSGWRSEPFPREQVREMLRHVPPTEERGKWRAMISAVACACGGNDADAAALLAEWDPPWLGVSYEKEIANLRGNYFCGTGALVAAAKRGGYVFPRRVRADAEPEKTIFLTPETDPRPCATGRGAICRARSDKGGLGGLWMPHASAAKKGVRYACTGRGKVTVGADGRKRWTFFANALVPAGAGTKAER